MSNELIFIASQINNLHERAEASAGEAIDLAHQAGDLMLEAKRKCKHGEWAAWLVANFTGSERTARAYMQVASKWPELESKRQASAVLTIEGALKGLSTPKPKPKKDAPPPKPPKPQPPAAGEIIEEEAWVCADCEGEEFDSEGDCVNCYKDSEPPEEPEPAKPPKKHAIFEAIKELFRRVIGEKGRDMARILVDNAIVAEFGTEAVDTPAECGDLPDELDTPKFRKAWAEWEKYRREKKQKLTKSTRAKQLKMLAKLGAEKAVKWIENSITNGWTGLFDPEKKNGKPVEDSPARVRTRSYDHLNDNK